MPSPLRCRRQQRLKLLSLGPTILVILFATVQASLLLPVSVCAFSSTFARSSSSSSSTTIPGMPDVSPATGLRNRVYEWKCGQRIRYQATTTKSSTKEIRPIVLVHGLFVNSDHWRKTLREFENDSGNNNIGYKVYALDLLGYGYSDRPEVGSAIAHEINGENTPGRFPDLLSDESKKRSDEILRRGVLKDVELGSADGLGRRIRDVDLLHPLESPYNFYTWSELIADFCKDVVMKECGGKGDGTKTDGNRGVTLVCNSIGTMSSLQAVIDNPDLFNGVFVISPNFRELHSAEVSMSTIAMPLIRQVQKLLRQQGRPLFDALAKPDTVKQILLEPYKVADAVDDVLVQVLLDPLLCEGACDIVFDTLSYSAGPLPEQQLAEFPSGKPVWIGYGNADPWTPGKRVEALTRFDAVEKVVPWDRIGHCPHDEAPELVHPMLRNFLDRVYGSESDKTEK